MGKAQVNAPIANRLAHPAQGLRGAAQPGSRADIRKQTCACRSLCALDSDDWLRDVKASPEE
jgi:hypothetical protein